VQEQRWYHHWFGPDYLELYRHRSAREAQATVAWLLRQFELPPASRVLDLACGNCRHAALLARRGFPTWGLDLSWSLLRQEPCRNPDRGLYRVRGDMRHLPFREGSFRLALSLFTSFGYFQAEAGNRLVLQEAARVLEPGGIFVLDFLNAGQVRRTLVPEEQRTSAGRRITIRRWVDEAAGRVEKSIVIQAEGGPELCYRESVRLYTETDLQELFSAAGLQPHQIFGSYEGAPFVKDSPRLILTGRKIG